MSDGDDNSHLRSKIRSLTLENKRLKDEQIAFRETYDELHSHFIMLQRTHNQIRGNIDNIQIDDKANDDNISEIHKMQNNPVDNVYALTGVWLDGPWWPLIEFIDPKRVNNLQTARKYMIDYTKQILFLTEYASQSEIRFERAKKILEETRERCYEYCQWQNNRYGMLYKTRVQFLHT